MFPNWEMDDNLQTNYVTDSSLTRVSTSIPYFFLLIYLLGILFYHQLGTIMAIHTGTI